MSEIQVFAREGEKCLQNDPKIEPKTAPETPRWPKNGAPKRSSISDQISMPFLTIFEPKMDPKMDPQIALKPASAPQGRPEASREPFGSHFA